MLPLMHFLKSYFVWYNPSLMRICKPNWCYGYWLLIHEAYNCYNVSGNSVITGFGLSCTQYYNNAELLVSCPKYEKLLTSWCTFLQLYMAPVTHTDRYSDSVDFWRNVYGIDSKCMV
jgi:hypothetical protein